MFFFCNLCQRNLGWKASLTHCSFKLGDEREQLEIRIRLANYFAWYAMAFRYFANMQQLLVRLALCGSHEVWFPTV